MQKEDSRKYLDWVDIVKGLGIICVVYAHIYTGITKNYVYLFHMPLFFFIGGYLFKPSLDYKTYLKKKVVHLLLPYLAFLILIFIPFELIEVKESLPKAIFRFFYGGTFLFSWVGIFWFVTCFFFTQQLFNYLATKLKPKLLAIVVLLSLAIAYINSAFFNSIPFPWAINIVFYALPVFYTGYIYKMYAEQFLDKRIWITIISFVLASVVFYYTNPDIVVGMKGSKYGIPVLSFLCSLAIINFIILISKFIADKIRLLSIPLRETGKASMVVMYLHQPIQAILIDRYGFDQLIGLAVAVILPVIIYFILRKYKYSSIIFLGANPK